MRFVSVYVCPSSYIEETTEKRIFEFKSQEEDYFLEYFTKWEKITTKMYKFLFGRYVFHIPSSLYVLVGGEDWIKTDELLSQPDWPIILMSRDFKYVNSVETKFLGETDGEFYFPVTKNPLPIADDTGTRTIIVSSVDQYHKFKKKDYGVFFV